MILGIFSSLEITWLAAILNIWAPRCTPIKCMDDILTPSSRRASISVAANRPTARMSLRVIVKYMLVCENRDQFIRNTLYFEPKCLKYIRVMSLQAELSEVQLPCQPCVNTMFFLSMSIFKSLKELSSSRYSHLSGVLKHIKILLTFLLNKNWSSYLDTNSHWLNLTRKPHILHHWFFVKDDLMARMI